MSDLLIRFEVSDLLIRPAFSKVDSCTWKSHMLKNRSFRAKVILFELKLSQPLSPHCDCDCDLVDVADCDRGEVDLWQGCSCVFNWGHRLLLRHWFFAEQLWPFKDFSYKSLINSAIWILCGSSNTWMNPKYLDELKIPGWSQNTWMNSSRFLVTAKIEIPKEVRMRTDLGVYNFYQGIESSWRRWSSCVFSTASSY